MSSDATPLIGITADLSGASDSLKDSILFLPQRYSAAVERAGGSPIVLPATPKKSAIGRMLSVLNGLVLSGGNFDIHPRYYNERPIRGLGEIKDTRTEFELEITHAALKRDLPILGICGGAQAINVALGGSLYQDIPTQLATAGAGDHSSKNPDGGHAIHIERGTRLFTILKKSTLTVNTRHHQAVKRAGRGLIVNALADDGVIEGIESTEHSFVLGVQWHPELLAARRQHQHRIFSSFVAACKKRVRAR